MGGLRNKKIPESSLEPQIEIVNHRPIDGASEILGEAKSNETLDGAGISEWALYCRRIASIQNLARM